MADKQPLTFNDLETALEKVRAEWADLATNPRLRFDAEREWVLQACNKNERAVKCALENIVAVQEALRNVAAVGVTLDPARKLAYVLPRDNKMVYDLSYMGLIDIAIASGALAWAQAARVHANDLFELQGYDAPPIHKRNPFAKPEARGDVIGAYVVVKTTGGDYLTNAMPIEDINAIRDRSPAWKSRDVNKATSGGPWRTDPAEMEKKTVVKNAYKYWPRSEALDRAVHYLNTDGGQGIDLAPDDEKRTAMTIADGYIKTVGEAKTGTEVATVWQRARTDENLKAQPEAYAKVREAVAGRNRALGVQPPTGTPTPSPTPTPAPTAAPSPTTRGAPVSPAGKALQAIDAARNYAELKATGPLIDALPANEQAEPNDAYNQKLEVLKKHNGKMPD